MNALAGWLLKIVVPPEDRRHILDELDELAELQAPALGPDRVESWKRKQIWRYILRALPVFWWKRPLSGFLGLMSNRDGRLSAADLLRQDLRFAYRSFQKKPGFVLAAVLILAVGIGATTTIFSVVDTVMLRPLPYAQSNELVHFGGYGGIRPHMFTRWRDGLESYDGIGASWNRPMALTEEGSPQTLRTSFVTADLLPMMGAIPHLGRLFLPGDFQEEPQVALLGYGFWQRNWGGDPSVVGRSIRVDGRAVQVAGILNPDFVPPEAVTGKQVDLWMPLFPEADEIATWSILSVVGRLKDGVGWLGAQEELRAFTENLAPELPNELIRRDGSVNVTRLIPLQISTFRSVSGPLVLLMWSVILMLLIACANVANLLLAHGAARSRELALRGALGADRSRIVRQLLTESITLALVAGIAGVGLAYLGVQAFLRFNPGGVPRIEELAVDPRILLFAFLASLATGLIFGTAPAIHAARKDVAAALQEGSAASSSSRRGKKTRNTLVVAEIALALVLLSSAGLFFRSLLEMAESDPGFEVEHLVTLPLKMGSEYDAAQRIQFTRSVKERLEGLPGTQSVAVGLTVPFEYIGASGCCMSDDITLVGGGAEIEPLVRTQTNPVTSGYFRTIGAEMSRGREFGTIDEEGDGRVVIINEPTARHFFGEGEALGRSLRVGGKGDFIVVGVVRGVSHFGFARGVRPTVYIPWGQWGAFSDIYRMMIRSTTDLETLAPAIRQAIWAVDPDVPVEQIIPMTQRVEDSTAGQRFLSILLGTFAVIALLLASGGIYASMLYSVGQRKKEMGIRLAMGAMNGELIRMVLKAALGMTLTGVLIGLVGSVGVSVVLQNFLFGIAPADPVTLATVVAVLVAAAILASLIPALKAARTDVRETLTAE